VLKLQTRKTCMSSPRKVRGGMHYQ
jgi:hypothetical protein